MLGVPVFVFMCSVSRKEYLKEWKKSESGKSSAKKYYQKTKCKWLALDKERNILDRDKRTLRDREMKEKVLRYYGNNELRCVRCGFSDIRALALDHINNNGNIERRNASCGSKKGCYYFYRHLENMRFPYGYQTLCYNCNIIKHRENVDNIAKQRIAEYSKGK